MSKTNRKILRINEVVEMVGMSKSTIYRWIDKGQFPKYVKLGATSTGWYSDHIESWINSLNDSEVV